MSTSQPPIDPAAFKKFEHAGWVEVAGKYDSTFARLTTQLVDPMLAAVGVAEGTRLLDVACGPGYFAASAAYRGAKAVGVDFSSTMVAEARRLHPGVTFEEGDAENLGFADASFDAVVIAFGMLHFAEPERALAEARRVLVHGGRIAFSVWDAPERALGFGLVVAAVQARGDLSVPLPPGPPFFRFSDPEECRKVLSAAGFVDIDVRTVPLVWRVASADAVLATFLESGVRTRALLRAQSPEHIAGIQEALRIGAKPFEVDGALELPTPCVLASARRG